MLDLGGIPLSRAERTMEHPLVIAGGPSVANPEPMSRFIDLFVIGDGEEMLPSGVRRVAPAEAVGRRPQGGPGGDGRRACRTCTSRSATSRSTPTDGGLAAFAAGRCRRARDDPARRGGGSRRRPAPDRAGGAVRRVRAGPDRDRDHAGLSLAVPLLPEHDDQAALAIPPRGDDRRGGAGIVSQHGLQRDFAPVALHERLSAISIELIVRLQETFRPLGVSVSVPSLRINEQLRSIGELLNTDRHSGLTLAPEAALERCAAQIGKQITQRRPVRGLPPGV